MILMSVAAILFAGALQDAAAAPAPASEKPATASSPFYNPAEQIKAAGDADKVLCKTEQQTGTRLGNVRICMTKAQWMAKSQDDQRVVGDVQTRAYTTGPH